jgi:ABC-2 type transport system permease protein
VARQFARLKIRLIRNGLRSPQYAVMFILGATAAGALALLGFSALAGMRNQKIGPDATLAIFAAVTVMWIVVPLIGFGTDETLDPQRLALLPLRRGQLLRGMLAAALVGVAPIATAFALLGAIVGQGDGFVSMFLIAMAVGFTLIFCVVGSRALIAILTPLLRSRRGRDMLIMSLTLAAFVPQAFRLFGGKAGTDDIDQTIDTIASRVRWTPFGLGGVAVTEAGERHHLNALLALAGIAALTAILLWLWSHAVPRAMVSADIAAAARTDGKARRTLFPRRIPLPRTRMGATAAKELRYYLRDPRRRGPLFAALVVPGLFLFQSMRDASDQPAIATMLGLVALLPASGLTLNQFGLDGGAMWTTVVTGNDPRADIVGRNLATGIIVAPLVGFPAILTAAATDGWAYVPITMGLAPGMLLVILAMGNLVSVYAPYALPDRKNPLASNPGQGCVGGLAALGALFADFVIILPVIVATTVALLALPLAAATAISVVLATIYGAIVWRIAIQVAVRRTWWRMPELLDAVSPRHAG